MKRIIFFDRDGVINVPALKGDYITNWKDFIFMPNVITTLKYLSDNKYYIFIITNQQCVGKNIISEHDLTILHQQLIQELIDNKINIEKIYFCPHLESKNCNCRKPKPGMLQLAAKEYHFQGNEMRSALMVGDSETDIMAGKKFGCKTVLLRSQLSANDNALSDADYIISEICDLKSIIDNELTREMSY
jgi:D-glycero-D-manno-heptose 1,7-bisphosphate phosphatase